MKTKLIETDEFETDFLQRFETKECMYTPDLLDFIDWEYSGCVLPRSSRINKASKRSSSPPEADQTQTASASQCGTFAFGGARRLKPLLYHL